MQQACQDVRSSLGGQLRRWVDVVRHRAEGNGLLHHRDHVIALALTRLSPLFATQPPDVSHPRLRRKATEYYSGWKPQLHIDTTGTGRRFSFEPGDDNDTALSAPPLEKLPAAVKHRLLRKSVSMSVLSERTPPKASLRESELSPVQQSPTTSVPPSDSRKPTRIPTPIHSNGSLARPRRDREDSSSSLLTVLRHADETCKRSDSASNSALGSPCTSRLDLMQENQGNQTHETAATASNPLRDHTNHLRGNAFAAAAAKAASAITTSADHEVPTGSAFGKRPTVPEGRGRTT